MQLIGTVSSPEKARLARQHGAWETIDYSHENVARRVLELTDGKKCPVVYDSVGKDTGKPRWTAWRRAACWSASATPRGR